MLLKLEEKIDFDVYDVIANYISDIWFFDMGSIINLNSMDFILIKNTLTTFMYRTFISLPQDDDVLRKKVMYSFCYLLLNPKENYFSITFNETSKAAIEGWIEEKTSNEEWKQTFGIWDSEKLREWSGKTWADWNTQALKEWNTRTKKQVSKYNVNRAKIQKIYEFCINEMTGIIPDDIPFSEFISSVEKADFKNIYNIAKRKRKVTKCRYIITTLSFIVDEDSWYSEAVKSIGCDKSECSGANVPPEWKKTADSLR